MMLDLRQRRRSLSWALPIAGLIAVVAFFSVGTPGQRESAFAGGGVNLNGTSCTDVWLGEFKVTNFGDKPHPIGSPPIDAPLAFLGLDHIAIALTGTHHDLGTNELTSVTQAVRKAIPGFASGTATFIPLCASVNNEVFNLTDVKVMQCQDCGVTLVNGTNKKLAEHGMAVYWNSGTDSREGFYAITDISGTKTLHLRRSDLAICKGATGPVVGLGTLQACMADNQGFGGEPPLAYNNTGTITGGILEPGTVPRANESSPAACFGSGLCRSELDKLDDCLGGSGNGCAVGVSCSPGTGQPENPEEPIGQWTRVEHHTVVRVPGSSSKVPSYGVTQLFTPVDPSTCENNASTARSTLYNVVWSTTGEGADLGDTSTWTNDWDGDGCLDWEELQSPQPVAGGGRDAFNPYDCDRSSMEGAWDVTAIVEPITIDGALNIIAGSFFRCRAAIDAGNNMPIYCYRDDPGIDVNPDNDPGVKGDGYEGDIWPIGSEGFPPEPYGDLDDAHSVMTAVYDGGSDTLSISGCLEDISGTGPEGYVYWKTSSGTDPNLTSGYGEVDIWIFQSEANCTGDTPAGAPTHNNVPLYIGRQSDAGYAFDQDLDGVSNVRELGQDASCGLRDPFNRYDYYDVSIPKDGIIDLFNDIVGVINNYEPIGYTSGDAANVGAGTMDNYDRPSPMIGGVGPWNRGQPDLKIDLFNDIVGVIGQYNPTGC